MIRQMGVPETRFCPMSDTLGNQNSGLRPNIGQFQQRKNLLIYNWASFLC